MYFCSSATNVIEKKQIVLHVRLINVKHFYMPYILGNTISI